MQDDRELTRRRFIAGSSLVAAAPMIITSRTRAQDPPPDSGGQEQPAPKTPPSEQITLGMIGAGIRCRNMFNSYFLNDDQFRVLAVCDVDTNRREHRVGMVNEAYGNEDCTGYLEYREMLERDDIDAVVIATPDHWHTNQVIHAAVAGKDVYSEKPLTLTLHEGKTIIDAVRKHNRVFQTGSQQRSDFDHQFVTACEYVRNGRIGEVLSINVGVGKAPAWCDLPEENMEPGLDWDRWLGPAPSRGYNSILSPRGVHDHYPDWREYREYSGGKLADMGAHHFDIAQWALGTDRSGPVKLIPTRNADAMYGAELVYENGVRLIHGGPAGATFVGRDGVLSIRRGRLQTIPHDLIDVPLTEQDERLPRHANHAKNWADCIRSRRQPICDFEIGAKSAAVCQLMNITYWLDKEVAWDPDRWEFDDPEANALRDYERRDGYELPAY